MFKFNFFRTLFELKLVEAQPTADFYYVSVNAVPKSSTPNTSVKQFFLVQNRFEVKVTTIVSLENIQVGAADRDSTQPKLNKYGSFKNKIKNSNS
jgi:hypothetical protein